ncbi:ABC transporter ATP-binding protein [Apilactobacillus apisilvae]|uniref:ABC transporter ATP-binding protein n=1 Tax=Apilactobacillus apisilvae TaxID=2923364 RepID=A0ABY4PHR6_9LACO|nr:ABC transporter ATP-binding protein [Apilactobacillus apisilvae]UQS85157.1 ABC transporter ATP-binding protein [Apilactobacillus apisilvae]
MSKIEIKNLNKNFKFGKDKILKDINLSFDSNKIYGLFGENGAGKSTLMNLIADYTFPTDGQVTLDNENVHDNDKALSKIYYMNQNNMYPKNEKVKKIFELTKSIYKDYDVQLQDKLVKKFQLNIKTRFNKLSTGYKSIVKIIIALCVPCEFIILDEPTLGLDARNRDIFYRELIESYSEEPRTFIISTHIIEEIDKLVSNVVMIADGKVVLNDTSDNIRAKAYSVNGPMDLVSDYTKDLSVIGKESLGQYVTIDVMGSLPNKKVPSGVKVTKIELQKLIVNLMNKDGANDN